MSQSRLHGRCTRKQHATNRRSTHFREQGVFLGVSWQLGRQNWFWKIPCPRDRPSGRLRGLPIRDCARKYKNRTQICAKLIATYLTTKTIFERLYVVLGLETSGPRVNCPYAHTTPPIHTSTISRFLSYLFARMAPQFFWYTIHQVFWPSWCPGLCAAYRG